MIIMIITSEYNDNQTKTVVWYLRHTHTQVYDNGLLHWSLDSGGGGGR